MRGCCGPLSRAKWYKPASWESHNIGVCCTCAAMITVIFLFVLTPIFAALSDERQVQLDAWAEQWCVVVGNGTGVGTEGDFSWPVVAFPGGEAQASSAEDAFAATPEGVNHSLSLLGPEAEEEDVEWAFWAVREGYTDPVVGGSVPPRNDSALEDQVGSSDDFEERRAQLNSRRPGFAAPCYLQPADAGGRLRWARPGNEDAVWLVLFLFVGTISLISCCCCVCLQPSFCQNVCCYIQTRNRRNRQRRKKYGKDYSSTGSSREVEEDNVARLRNLQVGTQSCRISLPGSGDEAERSRAVPQPATEPPPPFMTSASNPLPDAPPPAYASDNSASSSSSFDSGSATPSTTTDFGSSGRDSSDSDSSSSDSLLLGDDDL